MAGDSKHGREEKFVMHNEDVEENLRQLQRAFLIHTFYQI
jgi:hypothetical protein